MSESLFVSGNLVKTAQRIGRFVLREGVNRDLIRAGRYEELPSGNLIRVEYDAKLPPGLLTKNVPRVYIFAVNGGVKKIGGSGSQGGIRATLSFYENARTGSPGRPRFVIHHLIARELARDEGNEVSIYLITMAPVRARVCGLFSCEEEVEIATFYKEMERKCLEEFKELTGEYPEWNFQERGKPYPPDLEGLYLSYHGNRTRGRR